MALYRLDCRRRAGQKLRDGVDASAASPRARWWPRQLGLAQNGAALAECGWHAVCQLFKKNGSQVMPKPGALTPSTADVSQEIALVAHRLSRTPGDCDT